jgi:hypothetical protein
MGSGALLRLDVPKDAGAAAVAPAALGDFLPRQQRVDSEFGKAYKSFR